MDTSTGSIASIYRASIVVIASVGSVHATADYVAAIKRTSIAIVTRNRNKGTVSGIGNARFSGAHTFAIIADRWSQKASTLRRITRDDIAQVSITGASDGGIYAGAVCSDTACTGVANIEGRTVDGKELASDGGGHQDGAQVLGTRVVVIAVTWGAA